MKRLIKNHLLTLFLTLFILFGSGTAVFAQTIVEPLPDNNLMQNPWFRSGNKPSLAGWTDAAGSNVIWSLSQKQSNPGLDTVLGTSARLAFGSGQGGGTGQGGVDAYLYQVVAADASQAHLQFKIHWVTQWIDRATVTIYGGASADGPWTAVWTPLDVDQATSTGGAWTQTELLDTTIPEGFPFYKVELFARYPDGRQQGAKFTGVYFSVDGNAGEVAEPLPTETPPPPAAPVNEPEATVAPVEATATSASSLQAVPPTSSPAPTIAAEDESEEETAVAAINTAESEPTNQPRPTRPAQATHISPQPDATSSEGISGVYLLIIGILLLLVIVLGIGWARAARR
ncbi:hypothetical protein MNBD_CHLOROFLEXI01-1547 [hydrothermal vent metagenome]|uniref:Uncharacterized protein n=1 Tax=hydrothermal vent metagenome TaxID=652676 RepID=A0A3B0UN20_9ZZZZ